MPKFQRKPAVIEAIELVPGVLMPEGVLVRATTEGVDTYEVYNKLHDTWVKVRAGDLIRIDMAPEDVYPIEKTYLSENYDYIMETVFMAGADAKIGDKIQERLADSRRSDVNPRTGVLVEESPFRVVWDGTDFAEVIEADKFIVYFRPHAE